MLIKIGLFLTFVLIATGTPIETKSQYGSRIIGGSMIGIEQAPYQVSLGKIGMHTCGASIIGEKWLLTAGHCSPSNNSPSYKARVGSIRWMWGGTVYKLKRAIRHEKYDMKKLEYDFALLEVADKIIFNDKVQPVELPSVSQELKDNTTCFVSGWGAIESIGIPALKLRGVEVPIVNQEKCANSYKKKKKEITPRMVCAGFDEGGKDACQGDSGGPLVTYDGPNNKPILVGVVSWGYGCAAPNYPGVYARVQEAREWIFNNTGI